MIADHLLVYSAIRHDFDHTAVGLLPLLHAVGVERVYLARGVFDTLGAAGQNLLHRAVGEDRVLIPVWVDDFDCAVCEADFLQAVQLVHLGLAI